MTGCSATRARCCRTKSRVSSTKPVGAEWQRERKALSQPNHYFRPANIDELSDFLRHSADEIVLGAGLGQGGAPTHYREMSREVARFVRESLPGASADRESTEAFQAKIRAKQREVFAGIHVLNLSKFDGVLEFSPSDQVVKVGVHTSINGQVLLEEDGTTTEIFGTLQQELAKHGQCIPFARPVAQPGIDYLLNQSGHTVGDGLAVNRPHPLEAQCGSWRDWVLGMTVVLADGTIAKTGSKAVKNVAGYDVHELMIGARDTLGVIVDVTLRTFPMQALPEPEIVVGPAWNKRELGAKPKPMWTQRVCRSSFVEALEAAKPNLAFADPASSTLWCWLDSPDQELPRYPGDWVIRSGCGEKNLQFTDPTQIRLMKRAKEIFDPFHKLNPGEM